MKSIITTFLVLPWVLVILVKPVSAQSSTDVRYVFGPHNTRYASVGGGIDMAGFLHAYGGYAVKLTDTGETYYFGGLKIYPIVSNLMRVHVGPLYTLGSTTAESKWQIATGIEFFSEFVLFADVYLDAGDFRRTSTALGFRLPIERGW